MSREELAAGLMLVHGNQAESLRDLMVAWMKRYPLAPLENELILVQSNGIAQWLKLSLAADARPGGAGGCGIAAALEFSLPSRFFWQAYRALLGREAVPEASPFDKARLGWRLMRLLPAVAGEPDYAPLARFLAGDEDLRKRFQLAERLADLYDQYQVYRADWLAAWAQHRDELIGARGECLALPEEQRWQAALWRRLLADVGETEGLRGEAARAGRAAVHQAFIERAASWPAAGRPAGLPRRVMVFGISSLPRQSLEVLAALGRWTQVLMCVQNPCEHFWADIVADKDLLRGASARQARRAGMPARLDDEDLHLHAHPLLAAWGRQGRDFIALLDEHDRDAERAAYRAHFEPLGGRIDLFAAGPTGTLLGQLQDDIRDLRPLRESRACWPPLDPARDGSIRFHVAHGAQREVEILHDQLLAAFDADASLRPRDVIVMVPDIDAYAPHIQAVFGLIDPQDARFIPFSLADQGRRAVDPLIHALGLLLGLPQSRIAVSDVLDLLEVPALRARFGIAEDELPTLHRWIRGANVRWGLHAEQRASLGLPREAEDAAQNSWLFGLRRMLLGYAAGAGAAPWHGIEPYGEIGGLDAATLGPLAQLLGRLEEAWRMLRTPAPAALWCERLRGLLADFFVAAGDQDAFTLLQLEAALQRWQKACEEAAFDEALPLSVVGEHWLAGLDERGLGQRFFGGAVTFATLMPMRAIPFRRVCLLGMNDGDYPRARAPADFDLMERDYRPGDRSRREDDRYLFLEALLSAREALSISWVGRSIHDNGVRPPSVLVGQLRDHLAAGWRLAGEAGEGPAAGAALLAALTVEHRLQPFSADYFPPAGGEAALFTYAHEWRGGAAAAPPPEPALAPIGREEPLTLRELADFLKDPVKTFLCSRLGVNFDADDPAGEDAEPFVLDPLGRWQLQDELIRAQARALADGGDPAAAGEALLATIRRRGELAPGGFGEVIGEELLAPMPALFESYAKALARWPVACEQEEAVHFALDCDGQRVELADRLGGLRLDGDGARGRVLLEASDLVKDRAWRHDRLIRHWVAHLAGHLAGGPLTTEILSKVGMARFEPMAVAEAEAHLDTLMAAWLQGMCRPLPLAVKTGFAWLRKPAAARAEYEGAFKKIGEVESNPYLQRCWPSFEALAASGEFAGLAERLLRPIQQAAKGLDA